MLALLIINSPLTFLNPVNWLEANPVERWKGSSQGKGDQSYKYFLSISEPCHEYAQQTKSAWTDCKDEQY